MSKKVLILSSSPRKGGNSDVLCDYFLKGAIEARHQAEKIFIKELNINYCSGCGYCSDNEYCGCAQKDDMQMITEKMLAADVIVMATPIYFYTMCGQMKTLIDRCCGSYTKIKNKDFYFLMTAADNSQNAFTRTMEEFRGFLYCLTGAKEIKSIYAGGVWKKDEIKNTSFPKETYELAKSI